MYLCMCVFLYVCIYVRMYVCVCVVGKHEIGGIYPNIPQAVTGPQMKTKRTLAGYIIQVLTYAVYMS